MIATLPTTQVQYLFHILSGLQGGKSPDRKDKQEMGYVPAILLIRRRTKTVIKILEKLNAGEGNTAGLSNEQLAERHKFLSEISNVITDYLHTLEHPWVKPFVRSYKKRLEAEHEYLQEQINTMAQIIYIIPQNTNIQSLMEKAARV